MQTGKTLTFGYENAKGGSLSCILTDADGAVKYYGKLAEITSETSSGSLSIPLSGVADGTYTLNLFSEQCNDMEYTDFCSAPVTMTVSVTSETGTVSDFRGTVLHTHSWSDARSGDGTHHWHECTADGCDITDNSQKDGYGAHMFHWVTDREATQTESGLRHEECTVCGYKKDAVEIPATGTTGDPSQPTEKPDATTPTDKEEPSGTNEAPPTGDNSNYLLWIILALASSAGLTGTVIYRRRKKQNR